MNRIMQLIKSINHAFRNILALKQNALFNLIGLTIGFSSFALVSVWAYSHLSYDKFHKDYENIYLLNCTDTVFNDEDLIMPLPMAGYLRDKFPELSQTATYSFWGESFKISSGEKDFYEDVNVSDSQIFNILDFKFLQASDNFFKEPNHLAISNTMAQKIFGTDFCLGESLWVSDSILCKVAAVYKPFPDNSTFKPDIIVSFNSNKAFQNCESWNNYCYHTLSKIPSTANVNELGTKITQALAEDREMEEVFSFYPISKIHLEHPGESSRTEHLMMVFFSALLVLLVSCVNFINLLVAGFIKQNKQSGIRMVLGATKFKLMKTSFLETSIYVLISLGCSILISLMAIPYLSQLLSFNFIEVFGLLKFVSIHILVAIFTFLLVAIYPALLYAYRYARYDLLAQADQKIAKRKMNKAFVVFQFSIAIIIGIVAVVMQKQLNHALNADKGYTTENVIVAECWDYPLDTYKPAIKDYLSANPNVVSYCIAERGFNGLGSRTTGFGHPQWSEKENDKYKVMFRTDENLFETMGMKLIAGRKFDPEKFTENLNIIVNETYAKQLGGVDSAMILSLSNGDRKYKIVGVCQDFIFENFYQKIEPLVILYNTNWTSHFLIKTYPDKMNAVIAGFSSFLKSKSDGPFEIKPMKSLISDMYSTEKQQQKLLSLFGLLTIVVSCLGLFGLTIFTTERRVKEIGVRKVNGATILEIVRMLNSDFIKWVLFACVLACPVAFYFMHRWLEKFAFKTPLSWWIFALSIFLVIALAFITVTWQSIKAAKKNPVEALRYE